MVFFVRGRQIAAVEHQPFALVYQRVDVDALVALRTLLTAAVFDMVPDLHEALH